MPLNNPEDEEYLVNRYREQMNSMREKARQEGREEGARWIKEDGEVDTILELVASDFDPCMVERHHPDLVDEIEGDLDFESESERLRHRITRTDFWSGFAEAVSEVWEQIESRVMADD